MLRAGIHPTIAGVIVGMLTPVKSWFGREGFVSAAQSAIDDAGQQERDLLEPLRRMKQAQREAVSPVERHQSTLHPWVAYGIMPLFALANAGVNIRDVAIADATSARLMLGIVLGLGLGKPLGIGLASFVSVRLGVCALPRGVGWAGILLVGIVAGIGFTMAIFIAGLAFANPATLGAAKLAVLVGSLLAAACGVLFGKVMLPAQPPAGSALTLEEAETSTEK
jgi:NhaA family Na+:H+ antiporter